MAFTEVFGGQTVYPSQVTLTVLDLAAASVELQWPIEVSIPGQDVVADIVQVTSSVAGRTITMPDARNAANGQAVLFNNIGAETVSVLDADGGVIVSVASGECWMIYLQDNTTNEGVWQTFEFGAGTSTANAAALAGAGLKAITTTLNVKISVEATSTTPASIIDGDRAKLKMWEGGVGTFNLPDAATVGDDWFVYIRNSGSGDLTITPAGGNINGAASVTLSAGGSFIVISDGTDFWTIAGGSSGAAGAFDFTTINVAGSGDYTLSGSELNRVSYRFTGVLTGNRAIIVPNTVQQYWVDNATNGAFTLSVKTAAGASVSIAQGYARILYCDGNDVIAAEDGEIPKPVVQGGTGLTTVAQGDVLYASALNVIAGLAKDANATRYLSNTGASNNPAWAQVDLSNGVTGRLPFANITQLAALSVLGVPGAAPADMEAITGAANQVLRVDSGGTALGFGQVNLAAAAAVTGTLPVGNGGTGLSTFAQGDLIYASAANTLSALAKNATGLRALLNTGSSNNPAWEYMRFGVTAAGNSDITFALTDSWSWVPHTGASPQTWTIPTDIAVAFQVGTMIGIDNRLSGGTLTIHPDTGVTLDGAGTIGDVTVMSGYKAFIVKVASNSWIIMTDSPQSTTNIVTQFAGKVGSDGSTGNDLPSGWSVNLDTTGQYTVTHNLGTADYVVAPCRNNSTLGDLSFSCTATGSNSFQMNWFNDQTDTPVSCDWMFTLTRYN